MKFSFLYTLVSVCFTRKNMVTPFTVLHQSGSKSERHSSTSGGLKMARLSKTGTKALTSGTNSARGSRKQARRGSHPEWVSASIAAGSRAGSKKMQDDFSWELWAPERRMMFFTI